jgi:hypothetical protein
MVMTIRLSIVRLATSTACIVFNALLVPKSRATSIETEFLLTGVLPPVQNNTVLSVYHAGMHRVQIPDPYNVPTGFIAGDCADAVADQCNLQ